VRISWQFTVILRNSFMKFAAAWVVRKILGL
jgi:hypothetical protein